MGLLIFGSSTNGIEKPSGLNRVAGHQRRENIFLVFDEDFLTPFVLGRVALYAEVTPLQCNRYAWPLTAVRESAFGVALENG